LDAVSTPGVLVAGHAPFTWGRDASEAVRNAIALEQIAHMALETIKLNPGMSELPRYVLEKHFNRKHGLKAYYGQK
jgi:L-ribulose-5-phosphate 4-epimerase